MILLIVWQASEDNAHNFRVTEPGFVVPGCRACKKRLQTIANFIDHLADDVLPPLLDKPSSVSREHRQILYS
jgi:hypothetical protein